MLSIGQLGRKQDSRADRRWNSAGFLDSLFVCLFGTVEGSGTAVHFEEPPAVGKIRAYCFRLFKTRQQGIFGF